MHADDGDRVAALSSVICAAALASLNAVDRVGELKADSKFLDLGLVMALYFTNVGEMANYGAEPTVDFEGMEFTNVVVGYAKKAGIELNDVGVADVGRRLEESEEVEALKGNATATRWNYSKVVCIVGVADV